MKKIILPLLTLISGLVWLTACQPPQNGSKIRSLPEPEKIGSPLVAKGRELFFNETFNGNGRTCGTCHRAENNFTIDPAFIATLPDNDPLFVAEFIPALKANFENPTLMRQYGLIIENQDGFDDLENNFNMRSVQHIFAQGLSTDSRDGPHTGWSGDGAPERTLRSFATGAVRQHFTKTTNRTADVDFRFPTEAELDALEAFQLTVGRREELQLPLPLKNIVALRGQELFQKEGQCNGCHSNAGANAAFSPTAGNLNFATGVEDLPDQPADLSGELNPPDDGFGSPGNGEFNTPSLVEAADTPPFFHNNSVETIEGAVAFYNGDAFSNSPAGQFIANTPGGRINLDATQIVAVAAFLRVINALDNIREVNTMLTAVSDNKYLNGEHPNSLIKRSRFDIDDAINALSDAGLHPKAVSYLARSRALVVAGTTKQHLRIQKAKAAMLFLKRAKKDMTE